MDAGKAQRLFHLRDDLSQGTNGRRPTNPYQTLLTPRTQSRQVRTVLHRLLPQQTMPTDEQT